MNQKKYIGYQVIPDISVVTNIKSTGLPVIIYGVNTEGGGAGTIITLQDTADSSQFLQLLLVPTGTFRTDVFSTGIVFKGGCTVSSDTATRLTVFYQTAK